MQVSEPSPAQPSPNWALTFNMLGVFVSAEPRGGRLPGGGTEFLLPLSLASPARFRKTFCPAASRLAGSLPLPVSYSHGRRRCCCRCRGASVPRRIAPESRGGEGRGGAGRRRRRRGAGVCGERGGSGPSERGHREPGGRLIRAAGKGQAQGSATPVLLPLRQRPLTSSTTAR